MKIINKARNDLYPFDDGYDNVIKRQKSFGYTATVRNINTRKWYILTSKYKTTRITI